MRDGADVFPAGDVTKGLSRDRRETAREGVRLHRFRETSMNISKTEQRVLHALARGAIILHEREGRRVTEVACVARDGAILSDCDLALFERLRRRRLIESKGGGPYRIARAGRLAVRAQPDNRA